MLNAVEKKIAQGSQDWKNFRNGRNYYVSN